MEKAILIIDLPKMCADCPMFTWANITDNGCEKGFCTHSHKFVCYNERPLDCPLKPMPRKLDYRDLTWCNRDNIEGWNGCLEEILGDEE